MLSYHLFFFVTVAFFCYPVCFQKQVGEAAPASPGWHAWAVAGVGDAGAVGWAQPARAPRLSPGLVAGDLALATPLTFPHPDREQRSCRWAPCTQPEGFFHPCQDLIMCSPFHQNAEQQLNIGCNGLDYGFSN